MNRETIIQMAREAGLAEVTDTAESLPADYVEALAKLVNSGDAGNWYQEAELEVIAARQALALPTADHLPDAGKMVVDHFPDATKMIETAAPVGERELFERTMMDKYGWQRNDFKLDDFGYFDGHTDTAWMAWQARAALSAGDAVDAQRTPLTVLQYNAIPELCAIPPSLYESVVRAIERAHGIDAAMRKDKT